MLTQDELKDVLLYNPLLGNFTYKRNVGNRKAGTIAGSLKVEGYVIIKVNSIPYKAHRLAWLYIYGNFPNGHIDHIDHNKSNNRIDNLRDTTPSVNGKNRSKSIANTSGVTGVYWRKDSCRWRAIICVDGVNIQLGTFVSFSDAVDARKNAEILYNFHENHGKGTYE